MTRPAPAAARPPIALALVPPRPAERREMYTADGRRLWQRLFTDDGRCFQFIRTLQPALMGKVKSAVECVPTADGDFVVPPDGAQTFVAIKQLIKYCIEHGITTERKPVKENPLAEVAVMQHLSAPGHENVMRLVDFLDDADHVYLVYEFLPGGELFDQVSKHGRVPEESARRYIFDTLRGTQYIHGRDVCHRDLSLENAMLSDSPVAATAKIIDFGLAAVMSPPPALLLWDGRIGKERYMAPETYAGLAYDGRSIDAWCIGMMTFVLLLGIYPYKLPHGDHCPYFKEIAAGRLLPMLESWGMGSARASPAGLDFVNRLLCVDPAARMSVEAALAHEWMRPEHARLAADRAGTARASAAGPVACGGAFGGASGGGGLGAAAAGSAGGAAGAAAGAAASGAGAMPQSHAADGGGGRPAAGGGSAMDEDFAGL